MKAARLRVRNSRIAARLSVVEINSAFIWSHPAKWKLVVVHAANVAAWIAR
jgi:hypothetical protein